MNTKLFKAFMAAGLLAGPALHLIDPTEVHAQAGATVGTLRGTVKDKANGEAAAGATVVATSASLQGEQVVLADENGQYFITSLPPGVYTLTIYYSDSTFSRKDITIQIGKEAVVNVTVDSNAKPAGGKDGKGEIIEIQGSAPIIDQGSTKTGLTITDDYTRNIPTARTFGGVIGQAAGSQGDIYGTSISGATSAENTYIVEGINTTDTAYGGLSSNLPNEFIQETEVITGGYNAEYGRATGGIINVVTKSGTNQFHGSIFGYYRPGAFVSAAKTVQREGGSIDSASDLDYNFDAGAELGGPIIKDKLWFHVGINPSLTKRTTTRLVQSQVDKVGGPVDANGMPTGDGIPDLNAEGFTEHELVSSSKIPADFKTYYFTGKINGAVNANNQFQISAFGNPRAAEDVFSVTRNPSATKWAYDDGAYDLSAKWTSKLNEGKTQIDAVVGYHRGYETQKPFNAADNVALVRYGYERSLNDFADIEDASIIAGAKGNSCRDDMPGDLYPMIRNCPVTNYADQGLGFLEQRTNDRKSGLLTLTHRVKAAGYHTFKVGGEVEISGYDSTRFYTGGEQLTRSPDTATAEGRWQERTVVSYDRTLSDADRALFSDMDKTNDPVLANDEVVCSNKRAVCKRADKLRADTTNRSLGAFIQDSWQIRPNLAINLGLRYEQQVGYAAKDLQGTITPEGETVPARAFTLDGLFAPRLGFIYDPTSEGKAKIFGHWGRFYENVPMDLNVRAFGGEIFNFRRINASRKAPGDPGYQAECHVDHAVGTDIAGSLDVCNDRAQIQTAGGGTAYISPGMQGQYTQEFILGTEYEIMNDLKVGLNYINRSVPQVIEDISTDGGVNYLITNPSGNFDGEAAKLKALSESTLMSSGCTGFDDTGPACDADKQALAALQANRATQLLAVKKFDKPVRDYNAVQLTATQRPTKQSLIIASYTYSSSRGNYPGLFSTETGQADPNITSLFDLPDLMANRYGKLGLDRPHNLKIDAFYVFDLKKAGLLTAGGSYRVISGIAHNTLAAHPIYGQGESYLLPRGAEERSPITSQLDVHLAYGYQLNKTTKLEGFVNIFNMFNSQEELNVDEIYTIDSANPIVGGDKTDLAHVKRLDDNAQETNTTVTKNKNYNNTGTSNALIGAALQAPRNVQLGFRITF